MSTIRIASRYAKSLIDLAIERNELEDVANDMLKVQEIAKNRDLRLLIKSPIVNADKKLDVFEAIFKPSLGKTSYAFMEIIVKKRRESFLLDIITEFNRQYKSIKKISSVKLTTADVMEEDALEALKKKLLASEATKEDVEFEVAVDPSIIGGFQIKLDDKLYDASVASKLEKLKKEFTKNEYIKGY